MKTFRDARDRNEVLNGLDRVRPLNQPRWGTMSAHEMICHLSDSFPASFGEKHIPRATAGPDVEGRAHAPRSPQHGSASATAQCVGIIAGRHLQGSGGGGIPRLKRDLGNAIVRDMLLTGRSVSVDKALSVGLVSQVAAEGESLGLARSTATQIRKVDPSARGALKRLIKPVPIEELNGEIDIFM